MNRPNRLQGIPSRIEFKYGPNHLGGHAWSAEFKTTQGNRVAIVLDHTPKMKPHEDSVMLAPHDKWFEMLYEISREEHERERQKLLSEGIPATTYAAFFLEDKKQGTIATIVRDLENDSHSGYFTKNEKKGKGVKITRESPEAIGMAAFFKKYSNKFHLHPEYKHTEKLFREILRKAATKPL